MNRAIVITEPRNAVMTEIPVADPQDNEVQVKTAYLGLCGSDQHMFTGSYGGPHKYPVIMGHECSGIITAVGKNVVGFKVGDSVVTDANLWCGSCQFCGADKNLCTAVEKRGLTIDGAARAYFNIDAKHAYAVPENVDNRLACLAEPFAVSLHGIYSAFGGSPELRKDERTVIIGAGPIGMATAMLLKRHFGFTRVEISDLVQSRMEFAKRHGIGIFVPSEPLKTDFKKYSEIYDFPDAPHVIFESTGVGAVLDKAFHYVVPGGQIVCFAPIQKCCLEGGFPVLKAVTLIGSIGGAGYIPNVLEMFKKDQRYYSDMITNVFRFECFEEALELQCKDQNRMKIVLQFEH